MAINSYKIFLMGMSSAASATTATWQKLADIKDYPDPLQPPEMLETTTLSNKSRTYIPGIFENDAKEFTLNYDKDTFDFLHGLRGKLCGYAIWFGGTETTSGVSPTGSDGKYAWGGYLEVTPNGHGVNEVVNMTVSISPSTDVSVDGTITWGDLEDDVTPITFPT